MKSSCSVIGNLLLAVSAAILALSSDARPARAQCAPAAPVNNATVTCSGATLNQNAPNGYGTGVENNLTINVLPGASVTGTTDGFLLNSITGLTNNGAIVGQNDDGVDALIITSLINNGTISGLGPGGRGIESTTSVLSLVNRGTITGALAVEAPAQIQSLVNTGTITGTNIALVAIFSSIMGEVTNSGVISGGSRGITTTILRSLSNYGTIAGRNQFGVDAQFINSIFNAGTISGRNSGVTHVGGLLTVASVINHGIIAGRNTAGIDAGTSIGSLVNYGLISGGLFGVTAGIIGSLTNAGTIAGNTFAIRETGAADTLLTLKPGSVILGAIDLGGGVNTLVVGDGLSIANTFVGGPGSTVPVVGSTYGAPFAVNGNQIAVVDPTLEAFQDEMLTDLANGIFGGVSARLDGLAGGVVVGITQPPGTFAGAMHAGPNASYKSAHVPASGERQAWAHGFGAARNQDRDAPTVGAEHRLAGMVSGMDGRLSALTRAGFFLGGSRGEAETEFNSQDEDVETVFAGLYGRHERGRTALDLALTVGHSAHDRRRRVANNLAPTGVQTAVGDFDGVFAAAELGLATAMPLGAARVVPSVHMRYAGHFLDAFTETGAVGNLMLSDREVHVLQGRGQIAFPIERQRTSGAVLRGELKIGVEGRTNVGDDAFAAVLLGQDIAFAPGGRDETASIYTGAAIAYMLPNGRSKLYAGAQGGFEIGGASYLSGHGGLKVSF